MDIRLVASAENRAASAAAAEVNAKMASALAAAKEVAGVTAKTAGYSTQQVFEPSRTAAAKPRGWQVTQTLVVEATDFAAGANLGRADSAAAALQAWATSAARAEASPRGRAAGGGTSFDQAGSAPTT